MATPEKSDVVLEARQSGLQGLGVFSRREFQAGDVIALIEGKFFDEPSPEIRARSIQVGHGLFFQASDACFFLNHACDPSARLVVSDDTAYLEARKDVHVGDEITFNYCATELSMLVPFVCNCARCRHSSNRKLISGYHHLSQPEKRSLADDALPYLKEAPGMAENGAETLQPLEVADVRP